MENEQSFGYFWFVTFCGFATAFIPWVVRLILSLFLADSDVEAQLKRQLSDLRLELSRVHIVDEFAKYAKIQRKIDKTSEELGTRHHTKQTNIFKIRMILTGVLYFIMGMILTYLLWNYRTEPVLLLPHAWLDPFGRFLCAADAPGGLGLTPWLIVTTTVGRVIARHM